MTSASLERVTLEGGEMLMAHNRNDCVSDVSCTVHKPSDHHMRNRPQHWRSDRGMMERTCVHGIGHPDPDQVEYWRGQYQPSDLYYQMIHGCDGCCLKEE